MKNNIEEVLKKEGVYVSTTVGTSMYPMLRNRRDTIVISPCEGKLSKYDIPLYRVGDKYILHRIVEVHEDSYTILGDNRYDKEVGIRQDQIIGVLTEFYRGDKKVNMDGPVYKAYARIWYKLYPIRYFFVRVNSFSKRIAKGEGEVEGILSSMEQTAVYLAELIRCALHDQKAPEKPSDLSWQKLYHQAKRNSVDGISSMAVETLNEKPPKEIWDKWKVAANATLYKILQFDIEREQILAQLKKAGLSYLPLKGVHIAGYYPKPGMRNMADNDILYGFVEKGEEGYRLKEGSSARAQEFMDRMMKKRGYTKHYSSEAEDSYLKEPIYNYEMHKELFYSFDSLHFYYDNPWKRAILVEGSDYEYRFSDEDEYIYFLVHGYKHFSRGGCGIRLLIDEYVFLEKKGQTMDWKYIYQELDKIGITDFEKKISRIAKNVFGKEEKKLTEEEKELITVMLSDGTYGSYRKYVQKNIRKLQDENGKIRFSSKLKYIKDRIFMPEDWYRNFYPICLKYPILKVAVAVMRAVRKIVVRPNSLIQELKMLFKGQ